jgi:hypothetical protein
MRGIFYRRPGKRGEFGPVRVSVRMSYKAEAIGADFWGRRIALLRGTNIRLSSVRSGYLSWGENRMENRRDLHRSSVIHPSDCVARYDFRVLFRAACDRSAVRQDRVFRRRSHRQIVVRVRRFELRRSTTEILHRSVRYERRFGFVLGQYRTRRISDLSGRTGAARHFADGLRSGSMGSRSNATHDRHHLAMRFVLDNGLSDSFVI